MPTSFKVNEIFDIAGRDGLLVHGTLVGDPITPGDILRLRGSEQNVPVLSIDFPGPKSAGDEFVIMVPRQLARVPVPGDVLEGIVTRQSAD
jgi:hypothetical protein